MSLMSQEQLKWKDRMFGRRDTSILMTSSVKDPDRRPARERAELRSGRHAHAIFTNSYRKVLGQISARKFLQTIMGKRLGAQSYVERRPDVYQGTYKERLTSIRSDRGYSGVRGTASRPR
ncbi:somatoliberin [Salarias fasciatus]|uniref:somatoliberin n=1 Tax=Salarias fasciatus TaxID=181472 RepID=UPI001176FB6D|nr:somatoliberin [Salarias fasciatus]